MQAHPILPNVKLIAVIGRALAGLSVLWLALLVAGGDPFMAISAAACFSLAWVCLAAMRSSHVSHLGQLVEPRPLPALVRTLPWSPPDGDCPVILTVIRR